MRITHVRSHLIAIPFEHGGPKPRQFAGAWETMDSLLVRIDTDEGLTGWGEAFGFAVAPVTQAAIAHLIGPLCVGCDPQDLAGTMNALRKATRNYGRSGPVRYALSGIDVALWDLAGKIAGKPIHALLGGAKRATVAAYASFLPYHDVALVQRNTEAALAKGYRHIKLHETDVEAVAAARRVAGAGVELMLDVNCQWSLEEAVHVAHELEPYGLSWLEEPIYPPNDYIALAELRGRTSIPIALGENVGSAGEAERAAKAGAIDVFQPSATKIGGLGEMLDAMTLAGPNVRRIAPHSPFFGPAFVAALHVNATLDAPAICERFYCQLENDVTGGAIAVKDGMMRVPDGPGLGITIDERLVAHYEKRSS